MSKEMPHKTIEDVLNECSEVYCRLKLSAILMQLHSCEISTDDISRAETMAWLQFRERKSQLKFEYFNEMDKRLSKIATITGTIHDDFWHNEKQIIYEKYWHGKCFETSQDCFAKYSILTQALDYFKSTKTRNYPTRKQVPGKEKSKGCDNTSNTGHSSAVDEIDTAAAFFFGTAALDILTND